MRIRLIMHVARMRDEKYIQSFSSKTSRKETTRRPRQRWRKNLKQILKKKDVDYVHPTQDRDQWPALLDAAPKCRVP
jgi:hypothetical protein